MTNYSELIKGDVYNVYLSSGKMLLTMMFEGLQIDQSLLFLDRQRNIPLRLNAEHIVYAEKSPQQGIPV